jgi:hypothetical protein
LHADTFAVRAPHAKVRALPVVGYFLDHPEMSGGSPDYPATMEYVRVMQNITAAPGGALSPRCLAAYPTDQWKCLMSPYAQRFMNTPFFMFNSKFDFWQLGCILDVGCMCPRNTSQLSNQCAPGPSTCWSNPAPRNSSSTGYFSQSQQLQQLQQLHATGASTPIVGKNCNASQRAAILAYGGSFISSLAPVLTEPKNGAFITSCICHACNWGKLAIRGKVAFGHFSDWYYGRTSGATARALDPRGPNGDGDLERSKKEPGWENCSDGFYTPI